MVLAAVMDGEGHPVCTEMLPGNTVDVTVLVIVDRLRRRFGISRACVVADRGVISAADTAALEERGLDHILGARKRDTPVTRATVLKDGKRITTHTPVSGQVGRVFLASGIVLPPSWREQPP